MASRTSSSVVWAFVVAAAVLAGCSTYRDSLQRGRAAYEVSEHERALAILRGLENDLSHFSPAERTQYFYLRGQTDYRIGYKLDARHWLSLAKASDQQNPGSLPEAWKARLEESLTVLNNEIYGGGITSLANVKLPPGEQGDGPADAGAAPSPSPSTSPSPSPSPSPTGT